MSEKKQTKPPHTVTESRRKLVELHATIGTTQETIADLLGIDAKTLRKYYREELDQSAAKALAAVGGALYNKAIKGDTAAMIFWMKTRGGWRETQVLDHKSTDGTMTPPAPVIDATQLSTDTLRELVNASRKPKRG